MNGILLVWSCFCVVTDCCSLFQPVLACYSMFEVIFVLQIKTLQNILICKVIKNELHFWCYYKVEQVLIQADADLMCYKVERALLQSGASSITKSGNLYKKRSVQPTRWLTFVLGNAWETGFLWQLWGRRNDRKLEKQPNQRFLLYWILLLLHSLKIFRKLPIKGSDFSNIVGATLL